MASTQDPQKDATYPTNLERADYEAIRAISWSLLVDIEHNTNVSFKSATKWEHQLDLRYGNDTTITSRRIESAIENTDYELGNMIVMGDCILIVLDKVHD